MVKLLEDPEQDKKWKDRIAIAICLIFVIVTLPYWLPAYTGVSENDNPDLNYDGMSEYELRAKAIPISSIEPYARNPEKYTGTLIKFNGNIKQIQQNGDSYNMIVKINDHDVWVDYTHKTGGRPLEDDNAGIVGRFVGLKTYTTVLGASRTIPEIKAVSIFI